VLERKEDAVLEKAYEMEIEDDKIFLEEG